jgi:hypothetical protein
MRDTAGTPPEFKWLLTLAAAGFAAGFIGPMVFAPDANQGPLVGIFITGPAGLALGAVLWGVCALLKLPAKIQWRTLYAVAIVGVLTTLVYVQPDPKVRGYAFEGNVESCATPADAEAQVLDYWDQRIADITWAKPRAGWQADVHRLLGEAPGVLVSVRIQRNNAIKENRKPWNSGTEFAAGWTPQNEETPFYDANGSCDQYPDGRAIRGFQKSDYEDRLRSADIWPPDELLSVLSASALIPLPEQWKGL